MTIQNTASGGQTYFATLWSNKMHRLNDAEKEGFLKRLCHMANRDGMMDSVMSFMEQYLAQNEAQMKTHLKNIIQESSEWSGNHLRTAYILNSVYFSALAKEATKADIVSKPVLEDGDLAVMAQGFVALKYDDKLYDAVEKQTGMLLALDQVLRYHHAKGFDDWETADVQKKANYLTRLSRATDYAYRVTFKPFWKEDEFIPPIEMPDRIMDKKNVLGCYFSIDDRIQLRSDLDQHDALRTLQHEKAHQLSRMTHQDMDSYRSGFLPKEEFRIFNFSTYALGFLEKHSNKDVFKNLYQNAVEERLARSAEIPADRALSYCDIYLENLQAIFDDAPPDYNYMKEAFHRFGERSGYVMKHDEPQQPMPVFSDDKITVL